MEDSVKIPYHKFEDLFSQKVAKEPPKVEEKFTGIKKNSSPVEVSYIVSVIN